MATNYGISNDELKSLILKLATEISGLDSKVTGFSEKILSDLKNGVDDLKKELSSSQPEASSSSLQDPLSPEVTKEAEDSDRELSISQPEGSSLSTVDDSAGDTTVCTIQENVLHLDKRIQAKFDIESLNINLPKADAWQSGDNSQIIINKNDVDFDQFKTEILDQMNRGNQEILDILKKFKDQYDKQTKTETGFPDEVSKVLRFIISEVEKISQWHNQLVQQGVSISDQIKDVFQSVQGSNTSLTEQLSSMNSINENLQCELNSERGCIRRLREEVSVAQEERRKLRLELDNLKGNKQTLQQQIRQINIARGAIEFCFDISTLNSNVFLSEDNLKLSNNLSSDTPVQNVNGSQYHGVFGNKPIKPNQDIYFDVDVYYRIKEDLAPTNMIFEVAITNKRTLLTDKMDIIGWSFGARACEQTHNVVSPALRQISGMTSFFLSRFSGSSALSAVCSNLSESRETPRVCLTAWRGKICKSHKNFGVTFAGAEYSASFRVDVKRSRNKLTIVNNTQKSTCYEFTDMDEYGDLWPSFGIYNSSKVDVVLTLKPLLSYVD